VARYKIFIKPSAVKEIEALPTIEERRRILKRIRDLGANPRPPGCEKLSGQNKYRVRHGAYRIVYGIEDEKLIVYVVKVGHRKDVYR
jgi:mRNA interferase RelE/StbE